MVMRGPPTQLYQSDYNSPMKMKDLYHRQQAYFILYPTDILDV